MTRCLLAMLALLASCTFASADYILIVANLNAKPESDSGGEQGGMLGNPGGMLGNPGGALGRPGGMIGGPPGGMLGRPGGANMGRPGGMLGGPPMGGGLGFGGGGPGMPGMPGQGQGAGEEEADDSPDLVVVVLEVKSNQQGYSKTFAKGEGVRFHHKWGHIVLNNKGPQHEAFLLERSKGVPLATVAERFKQRHEAVFKEKDKAPPEAVVVLALWALEHGLVKECGEALDKLADADKSHTAAVAYLKVKAELSKPLNKEDVTARWQGKLLDGYKVAQTDTHHFALLHSGSADQAKAHLDRLENTYRGFYYWWALRGVALPVSGDRQVAVLTEKEKTEDFKKLQNNLTSSPVLTDSFHARREGVAVFAGKRGDNVYDKLDKAARPIWEAGWVPQDLLTGLANKGIPKTVPQQQRAEASKGPRTVALLLKALENEWEQTGMSHEASRQMLYSSKLLPHNVHAPEWVQFGMGSFFETPLQSPWATIGAANPYWLPRFKELRKGKKFESSHLATLKAVVTDAYFREKPKGDKADDIAKAKETNLRKARASSWALTYYLARQQLPGLQRYFKELSKQPRDVELDEKALWACFVRAFDGEQKVGALASSWINFIEAEKPEAEEIHKKIREYYAKMNMTSKKDDKTGGQPGPGPGLPGPKK